MIPSAASMKRGAAGGAGWAIMLADLALILFIVTASHAGGASAALAVTAAPDPVPQAIYRPAPGAPPLADWIAQQPAGEGASLQITLGYDPADPRRALDEAARLAAEATGAGAVPRIVLVPGGAERAAVLSFDR